MILAKESAAVVWGFIIIIIMIEQIIDIRLAHYREKSKKRAASTVRKEYTGQFTSRWWPRCVRRVNYLAIVTADVGILPSWGRGMFVSGGCCCFVLLFNLLVQMLQLCENVGRGT